MVQYETPSAWDRGLSTARFPSLSTGAFDRCLCVVLCGSVRYISVLCPPRGSNNNSGGLTYGGSSGGRKEGANSGYGEYTLT